MIICKNTVGSSSTRGGLYNAQRGFASRRPRVTRLLPYEEANSVPLVSLADNTKIYRLRNEYVDFILREDLATGVRIDKFKYVGASKYFVNYSRKLWELAIRRQTVPLENKDVFVDKYYIRPDIEYFQTLSVTPVTRSNGTQSFTFEWKNIRYNYADPSKTCDVTVIASLGLRDTSIDLSVSVSANHAISERDNQVCISAVGMPSLGIKKYDTDSYHSKDFLSVPVQEGQTILNPIKYLTSPRFNEDSFQYNENAYKNFFINPDGFTKRASFLSPGIMSIPLLIYGNMSDMEGFLYYAMDPTGLHAKNFQYFSDSSVLHIRSFDLSDHAIDPWGMGGKDTSVGAISIPPQSTLFPAPPGGSDSYGSITNQIGWTVRIRPFISPTKWADQYGAKLYKKEVVPELEEFKVIPKSFYDRYLEDTLDLRDIEMPTMMVSQGFLSGTADPVLSGLSYFQNLYKDSTSPSREFIPKTYCLHYSANSSAADDSQTGIYSNYFGWEPWANHPLGTVTGYAPHVSPDFTGVNATYSGVISEQLLSGQNTLLYVLFPFTLSSGSTWVASYSGCDFAIKPLGIADNILTVEDYQHFAKNYGRTLAHPSGLSFQCCPSIKFAQDKQGDIAKTLAQIGANIYHDTLGLGTVGCFARSHNYLSGTKLVSISHPRANASYYFNSRLKDWLKTSKTNSNDNVNGNWILSTSERSTGSFNNVATSEFPTEAYLNDVGASLITQAYGVTASNYLSPSPIASIHWTGLPRSDVVLGTISTLTDNIAYIEKPNWNITNPIYATVYGDRAMLLDWIGAAPGNSLSGTDYFSAWKYIPSPGVDFFGNPNLVVSTFDDLGIQNKNWLASRLNTFPRLITAYQSPQFALINSAWSGATLSVEQTMDNSNWSGVKQYTKNIFRLLAYAPDHMYHGYNEHNLEEWTVANDASAYGPRALRLARTRNSANWNSGDDAVFHGARRKRDGTSVLMWFANWTNRSQGFTGDFDPAAYEFNKGYSVYSIGLSESDNGQITDLGIYSKNTQYPIRLSIAENEFKALVFEPISSTTTDTLSTLITDFTYVRYAYTQKKLLTTDIGISYEYSTPIESRFTPPSVGFLAPATQAMTNNLPQWMKLRQDTSSVGWKLVNSWGQNFETLLSNVQEFIPNKYVATSDLKQRSLLNYLEISNEEFIESTKQDNLLFNSSFTIKSPARHEMPAGWSKYNKSSKNVSLIDTKAFICPGTLRVINPGKFGQTVYLNNTTVKDITSSIYFLSDTYNVDISLLTQVEMIDGTSYSKQTKINTRSTEWRRLIHTVPVNGQVYRIQIIVFSDCSETVYFNAPKMELNSKVTKWTKSPNDYLQYAPVNTPLSSVAAIGNSGEKIKKTNIFPVGSEEEFLNIDVPTSVELLVLNNPGRLDPFTSNVYGRKVSFLNEIFDTQWTIEDKKIKIKSFTDTQFDVYRELDIKDLTYNEEGAYGIYEDTNLELEPLLCCIKGTKLFILCKETYNGVTKYVLKIVKALEPLQGMTYLESLADFEIDLPINRNQFFNEVSEAPTVLAFSEVDSTYMVITTNLGRQFYCKLSYDYYYYQDNAKKLYTIESYADNKIQTL